jgi:hypothetical protein
MTATRNNLSPPPPPRNDLPLTHIVLALPRGSFARLLRLITDPDPGHQGGGYQGRKRKWRSRINEALHSIELDADDVDWIRRQIMNRNGGGWQKKTADIFEDQHGLFFGLPIKPKKRSSERKHRKGNE